MKILIIKFRNIGDVLLVSPLLKNLKNHYQNSSIDIAINKGTEAMVDVSPYVENVFTYNREGVQSLTLVKKIWEEFKFIRSFRKRHYDIVINLTEGDRGTQIALFSKAKIRVGYPNKNKIFKNAFTHYLPEQKYRHTLETNLDPLRVLGIPIKNKRVEIFWDKKDQIFINSQLSGVGQFIHIHPVSRWMFKCINDQTTAKIIDYCELKLKIKVVITAAPIDKEINKVNSILAFCKSNPINLSAKLSLKQIAALNKKSKIFIGVDTAIMHISAANDIPVLSFFGPSGAHHWGPWDNSLMESSYKNKNGMQSMGMHRVISESRNCQPCGKDGCNGTKISDCLMNFDLSFIKKNIQKILE
jgi:heptosyltransferase-3